MPAPWAQGWTHPAGGMPGHQTRSPQSALSREILRVWCGEDKANSFRKASLSEAIASTRRLRLWSDIPARLHPPEPPIAGHRLPSYHACGAWR